MTTAPRPVATSVHPGWAVEQGRIDLRGSLFDVSAPLPPEVTVGGVPARVVFASPDRLGLLVPAGLPGGPADVRVGPAPRTSRGAKAPQVVVGRAVATGLHQVDSPVIDRAGNLYVTYSGPRGQKAAVSIFRVRPNGNRETFVSGIVNATSMAVDPKGVLHVSSRFEGTVYRVGDDGSYTEVANELGVACGLAFDPEGALYVGDRGGTIFRVTPGGRPIPLATLPASVAAFHLAMGPDRYLYVTAPTLDSCDVVYRVGIDGLVEVFHTGFGRPQGLAFDADGALYVVEALAGGSGLYRFGADRTRTLVLSAPGLIGVAFDPAGGLVACTAETAYRFDVPVRPLTLW